MYVRNNVRTLFSVEKFFFLSLFNFPATQLQVLSLFLYVYGEMY